MAHHHTKGNEVAAWQALVKEYRPLGGTNRSTDIARIMEPKKGQK